MWMEVTARRRPTAVKAEAKMNSSKQVDVLFKHLQAWHLKSWADIRHADASMQWKTMIRLVDTAAFPLPPLWFSHLLHVFPDICNPSGLKRRFFNDLGCLMRRNGGRDIILFQTSTQKVLLWPFKMPFNGPKQMYSNAKNTLSSGSRAVLLYWPLCNIITCACTLYKK